MIELSVSDVRAELARVSRQGDRGAGEAGGLLLGKLFHSVFADLVGGDPERSGMRVIAEAGETRQVRVAALLEHAWRRLVAPRVRRHAAELQASSEGVRTLWQAVETLCGWLVDVVTELMRHAANDTPPSSQVYLAPSSSWEHLTQLLSAEVPLSCELLEPGWTEPVLLKGVADSILRVPGRDAYLAIELKLGRSAPPIDLAQAALYRLILTRTKKQPSTSALAVLRFSPSLDEHLFEAAALAGAEARLLDVIATLGKVPKKDPPPIPDATLPQERSTAPAHANLAKQLERACREHGVGINVIGAPDAGPRFLRFTVRLAPGARLNVLERRMPEVAHRLGMVEPIVTQEAGSLYIDVARPDPKTVCFEEILSQLPGSDALVGSARVPVGVDSSNTLKLVDLASAGRSHFLVAGTSGSGKSEWLRMALAGLLQTNTPDTLRIVTIDPKLNAFADLEKSPFLWTREAWWIPGNGREASEVFEDLVEEMERRYQLTRESGSDNLADHVKTTGKPLPRIVCLCDEYMSLVLNKKIKDQIEQHVGLLGAKARAAGIHLVLATQQPSRNIISGAIQTNLPCRVALTLTSHIESAMILGERGAERLTSNGDLLYKDFGAPVRLQAPYLAAEARKKIFAGGRL